MKLINLLKNVTDMVITSLTNISSITIESIYLLFRI